MDSFLVLENLVNEFLVKNPINIWDSYVKSLYKFIFLYKIFYVSI